MHATASKEGHKKECLRVCDVNAYIERWWVSTEPLQGNVDAKTKATIKHERFSIHNFLIKNPCPPKVWTLNWVKEGGWCSGHGPTLPFLKGTKYEEPNLKWMLLNHHPQDHEYPCFSQILCWHNIIGKLWYALSLTNEEELVRQIREAGIILKEHRGFPCMQFYYNKFHFMLGGRVYYLRPGYMAADSQGEMAILLCHKTYLNHHWSRIGGWKE